MSNTATMTAIKELRELAGCSIHQAAGILGVSYSKVWSAEGGYGKLSGDQEKALVGFYRSRLDERLRRISEALQNVK